LAADGSIFTVLAGLSTISQNNINVLTDVAGAYTSVQAFDGSDTNNYILTADVVVNAGTLLVTDNAEAADYGNYSSSQSIALAIPAGGLHFKRGSGGVLNDIDVNNISIREASGYGAAINVTSADAQKYTFNGSASPNTWTGADTTVIEVAGT